MKADQSINGATEAILSKAPEGAFFFGAISQYLGASLAVWLFEYMGVASVAWLRVLGAAIILCAIGRVKYDSFLLGFKSSFAFGAALAGMNLCFYLAVQRLPLGNAVAIEFLGPIAVALLGGKSLRSLASVLSALIGVVLIADISTKASALGLILALMAGVFWAGYIIAGSKVARSQKSNHGLAISMMIAAALLAIPGGFDLASSNNLTILVIALGLVTGLLSNAIPYSIDQKIMTRVSTRRFALMQAMLPVTALAVGFAVLGQVPELKELLGVLFVAVAIAINRSN